MIGIWYYDPVSIKWLLFESAPQLFCTDRLLTLRSVLPNNQFKIARRRPTAAPR